MFRLLWNVLNLSEIKLLPESYIIFFDKSYSGKMILHVSIRPSADVFHLHDYRKLAVIIYNTNVVSIA